MYETVLENLSQDHFLYPSGKKRIVDNFRISLGFVI